MAKVLIAPATLADVGGPYVDALQGAGFELVYPKKKTQMTEAELIDHLGGIAASVAGSEPYTRRVLAAHPQLRVIARAGVGYDAVDLQAALEHAVAVTITPNTNQDAVAEHTFTLILALAKSLISQHIGTIKGQWPRQANLPLRGRTLAIAGLGRIGKAVAIRGACFGMRLLAYEPFPDHGFAGKYGVTFVTWEELLAQADYLSLHLPATKESRHMINRQSLAKMKPTAFVINTARGTLINEPDLVEALRQKKIGGAGIDVFDEEPPGDHPLFHLDNVVITPHAAGVDLQSRDDMAFSAAQAIVSLSRGEWPAEKVVNPDVRAKYKW
ncbi:MAG TPA: phosphoglycerate dehydrogenase [Gemmataceae bacterium]|jgi:D-3-phosphoglycerate dehydrogenase|nr:phosphoglycerate dehydrogenase [Gemmataceae bacterium]